MTSKSEWGDEVMPGVFMNRSRSSEATLLAALSDGQHDQQHFQRIHEDIDETYRLIGRLRHSNEYMIQYLEEDGKEEDPAEKEVVREAIKENEVLVKEKEKELRMMMALVANHRCAHRHNHLRSEEEVCVVPSPRDAMIHQSQPLLNEAQGEVNGVNDMLPERFFL